LSREQNGKMKLKKTVGCTIVAGFIFAECVLDEQHLQTASVNQTPYGSFHRKTRICGSFLTISDRREIRTLSAFADIFIAQWLTNTELGHHPTAITGA
jgi:hypothetical protein